MEENPLPLVLDGYIERINFAVAATDEICKYSTNHPISHPSQLTNPFLGLPTEIGKCESCGTSEQEKCEGHFGYLQLPVPVYHPSHLNAMKNVLSIVCLRCLRMKKGKVMLKLGKESISTTSCSFCKDLPPISVKEVKTTDGAYYLELKAVTRTRLRDGFWNFLDKFGCHYGEDLSRPFLPLEALKFLKALPQETRKKLSDKGYFPQEGLILEHLPVPPNCLYIPDYSDGKSIYSSDVSITFLRKVLNKIEMIKRSRSGSPNFESHTVEANDLQTSISQYMHLRGTTKAPQNLKRFIVGPEAMTNSGKQWLEKVKTLFISKGSGFSSRSIITGDSYQNVNVVGLPREIAKKITFEERVTRYNKEWLQELVDKRLCLTYKDGDTKYAISVGSKGHKDLRIGQVVNRQIMDGDIVFINRPPTTHKHSLQAFSVYIHDDDTVKINPLVCSPLGADFDGDCMHLFYPQSLPAKAEAVELLSLEKQLLSSHSGKLIIQFATDSLLALKRAFSATFFGRAAAQQLSMFTSTSLPPATLQKIGKLGPYWTICQLVQSAFPKSVDSTSDKHLIRRSEILKLDYSRDALQSMLSEVTTSIYLTNGPKESLHFFNLLQPLLMEILFMYGYSVDLRDFNISKDDVRDIHANIGGIAKLIKQVRSSYNDLIDLQIDSDLKTIKHPVVKFILWSSALGNLIDTRSDSSIMKVVQQLGFVGLQLFDRGKLYSKTLVDDIYEHFLRKSSDELEALGVVKNSFFHGLNAYELLVHSISSREITIRSSRGLTEPGTLFKNLMAILRDVAVCYDGTVRNICCNTVLQFCYGSEDVNHELPSGEPVGVLAATAISNPAYNAVLNSTQDANSSWELMKEVLQVKTSKNSVGDGRVILYLNDCYCGKKFCKEKAAFAVQNCLKRVTVRECALDFSVEYKKQISSDESSETSTGPVGHIHLDKMRLKMINQSMESILRKCNDVTLKYAKKKAIHNLFKNIQLSVSECCTSGHPEFGVSSEFPCLQFTYCDESIGADNDLGSILHLMANTIYPILLDVLVKGDPRVGVANIVWLGPDSYSWVRNSCDSVKGELAVEVVLEKHAVHGNDNTWGTVLDACLPVIHLVDTKRSIPYGIQQINQFLGISSAFDQSVQRLATAIRSVAKGVSKEHLILVSNSMTCTGNVIGFRPGGFRSMFRSLNVQVPFTEMTLYTPMKCFERAAEKCHTDSLNSVVSSCLWGRHVAVGTGRHFQVLWDSKQDRDNKDVGNDVYDFLGMMKTTSSEGETTETCFGVDIDNLEEERENNEPCSPETGIHFEDDAFGDNEKYEWSNGNRKMENNDLQLSWDAFAPSRIDSDISGRWGQPKDSNTENSWSSWDSNKQKQQQNNYSEDTVFDVNSNSWSSWDSNKQKQQQKSHEDTVVGISSNSWSSWDSNKQKQQQKKCSEDTVVGISSNYGWTSGTNKNENNNASSRDGGAPSMSNNTENNNASSWDVPTPSKTSLDMSSGWNRSKDSNTQPSWGESNKRKPQQIDNPGKAEFSMPNIRSGGRHTDDSAKVEWRSRKSVETKSVAQPSWDVPSASKIDSDSSSGWGQPKDSTAQPSWVSNKKKQQEKECMQEPELTWQNLSSENQSTTYKTEVEWGNGSKNSVENKADTQSSWDVPSNSNINSDSGWNQPNNSVKSEKAQDGWSQSLEKVECGESKIRICSSPSQGWGSGRKSWKTNSNKLATNSTDQKGQFSKKSFTPTLQRAEVFSADEEKIRAELEPIMTSIRNILHGCSMGEHLSPENQNYILENVFKYHPDKEAKVTDKIDYVMVDKHKNFSDSRCFFVVSCDGSASDFSYLKCLQNFVKENHPDLAESFNRKFFKRLQQSRQQQEQQQQE